MLVLCCSNPHNPHQSSYIANNIVGSVKNLLRLFKKKTKKQKTEQRTTAV